MRIGITGGASAGHVVPALAVAAELERQGGAELVFFGRPNSIEEELATRAGVRFVPVTASGLKRYRSARNIFMPFSVVRGVFQAWHLVRRERLDVMFSKGSYVAVPAGIAAWLSRVPLVIHESDRSVGLANRLLAPFAKRVLLSVEGTRLSRRTRRKAVTTGLPVRDDLVHAQPERLRKALKISADEVVLLVFCGSSGSVRINEAIRGDLARLCEHYTIVHVTGRGNVDESLSDVPRYHQFEYLHEDMVCALWLADVIVGRAGATTLSELSALNKPAVVVPLPTSVSRGDQIDNAEAFSQGENRMVVVDDADMPRTLPDACIELAQRRPTDVRVDPEPAAVRRAARQVVQQILAASARL